MPKITRITQKIFGINAASNQVTAFGTAKEDNPTYTKDPAIIQNANFLNGWNNAIEEDKAPFEEDSNGLYLAVTSQLAYLFQQGISEWDSATAYYTNSLCAVIDNGNLIIKRSASDNNVGNNPLTDDVNWVDYYSLSMLTNKADIDLSNAAPGENFIETAQSWLMPDYSKGISLTLSNNYTFTSDGWVNAYFGAGGFGSAGDVYINGKVIAHAVANGPGDAWEYPQIFFLIQAGDVLTTTGSISFLRATLFPFKGGN